MNPAALAVSRIKKKAQELYNPVRQNVQKYVTQGYNAADQQLARPYQAVGNIVQNRPNAPRIPIATPLIQKTRDATLATAKFLDPVQTPTVLSRQGMQNYGKALQTGFDATAYAYGAGKLKPMAMAGGGAIGAGISAFMAPKGKRVEAAKEGFRQGVDFTPYMTGFLSKTNPAQSTLVNRATANIQNPLAQQLVKRGAGVVTNIAEGIGLAAMQGRNPFDPQTMAYDLAFGAALPAGGTRLKGQLMAGENAAGYKNASNKFSSLADKMPRFEISDRQASLKIKGIEKSIAQGGTRLGEILDHKGLYRQYPEFEKLRVIFKDGGNVAGSFDPRTFTLTVNPKANRGDLRSTILHEVQHAIQTREKFAGGGNLSMFDLSRQGIDDVNKKIAALTKEQEIYNNMLNDSGAMRLNMKLAGFKGNEDEYRKTLAKQIYEISDQVKKLQEYQPSEIDRFKSYNKLSGEIEARDVSARESLSPEQRIHTQPYASQNIPLKDQIVLKDGGVNSKVNPTVQGAMKESGGKYKTTVNINDENDLRYLRKIFSEDQIKEMQAGKMTNWRGTSYEDIGRINITSGAKKAQILDTLNPTGGLFVDYTPDARMKMPLGDNMTTLANTMKKSPDTEITIYRGVSKAGRKINGGDFVTTSPEVAKGYGEHVIAKKVKLGDVLDDINDPLGDEYLYRPNAINEIKSSPLNYKTGDDSPMMSFMPKSNLVEPTTKVVNGRLKIKMKPVDGPKVEEPDVLKQAREEIGRPDEVKPSLRQRFDQFYTDMVNPYHPVESMVTKIENSTKSKIRTEFNPKYMIKRLLGAGGMAEFRHKKTLEPIINELGDIDKKDFDVFLKAQRDIEKGGQGVYGSDPVKAQARLDALGQKYDLNKFSEVADKLYAYQAEGLQKLKAAGFLSDESVEVIQSKNTKYVPFNRIQEELDNYLGVPSSKLQQPANPVAKMKGSDKAIESPLESIIANTYKIEAAIAKNNAAKSIVNLGNIDSQYKSLFQKADKSGDYTFSVWENGKKNYYSTTPEIAAVIKGLNEENTNSLVKMLSIPARFFRQQTTGRNPFFFIPNIVRDQFDAAVNSKYGYTPFIDYLGGLAHLWKYEHGGDEIVEQWYKSGGSIFFENMSGRKKIKEQIADAAANKGAIEKFIGGLVGGIDTLGKYSEVPTRIGLFKKALQKTGNADLAVMEAREGSVDFARIGAKMKVLNSLIPFLNTQVQGADIMIRSAKDHPKRFGLALTATALLPQTMLSLYNNYYHGEDYAKVPDFEKETNLIFMTGEKDSKGNPVYLKLPKGHIQQIATAPVDSLITYMAGNNPPSFQQMALSMISGAVPGMGQGDNVGDIASRTVGGNMPQFAKPVVEAVMNKDTFRNQPIVDPYTEKLPPAAQFYSDTPEQYKQLGGQIGVSPEKLGHIAEGYGGGLMKEFNNMVSTAQEIAGGNAPNINKVPLVRRFMGSYSGFDNERPGDEEQVDAGREVQKRQLRLDIKKTGKTVMQRDGMTAIQTKDKNGMKRVKIIDPYEGQEQPKPKTMKMGFFDGFFKPAAKEEPVKTEYEKQIEKDANDEAEKKNFEASGYQTGFNKAGDKLYIKPSGQKSAKVIDLTPPDPTGNVIQQAKQAQNRESQIKSVGVSTYFDAKMPEASKQRIYEAIGTNAQDVEFRALDSLPNTEKASIVYQILKDRKGEIGKINTFIDRKILTNDLATKMLDEGFLTDENAKALKTYIAVYNRGKSGSKSGGRRGRKLKPVKLQPIKFPKSTIRIKMPKLVKLKKLIVDGKKKKVDKPFT